MRGAFVFLRPLGLRSVGSITHCAGYRAAAVARDVDLAGIGIDAEPHGPLPGGVLQQVTLAAERDRIAELAAAAPDVHWGRLLFSAKESVYKAWYPLTGRWLGFTDARLGIDPDTATFTAAVLIDATRRDGGPPLARFTGRFRIDRGLVVTAACVAPH